MDNRIDPRVNNLLENANKKMADKNKTIDLRDANQNVMLSEETLVILEEIDKLRKMFLNIKRDIKVSIQEELDERLKDKTIISEGKGDELTIQLGGHQFKGRVQLVKKPN